jgi:hypothetical protein
VCLLAPLLIFGVDLVNNIEWYQRQLKIDEGFANSIGSISQNVFGSFKIGYELLIYNGLLTFAGLWLISRGKGTVDREVRLEQ